MKQLIAITRSDCYTCKRMAPIVEKLCKENNIELIKIDETHEQFQEYINLYCLTKAPSYVMISESGRSIIEGSFKPAEFKVFFGV